jgi:16S rRNA (guanine966-N2)-methyltransferase
MSANSSKPKTKSNLRNRFRIIAGQWRGRVLSFADVADIRPTADRVRETLFNWLQSEIVGANCLDAFAGSGALGFEALSRGAATVTCLELSNLACDSIKENMMLLHTDKMVLLRADTLNWLQKQKPHKTFDIIFLDPPFSTDYLQSCCELLESQAWLSKNAFIYLEANSSLDQLVLPKGWQLEKQKRAGQVFFGSIRRVVSSEQVAR